MKNSSFTKLQNIFALTRHELTFVIILLVGLTLALIINISTSADTLDNPETASSVQKSLDSLALIQNTDLSKAEPLSKDSLHKSKNTTRAKSKKSNLPLSPVNINTASKSELILIPQVGPKTAEKIIEYRQDNVFYEPEDLLYIKGIGLKKLMKIKPFIKCK
ncbi:MAG: helix-hairpin-helix domain-containing protein [Candidatus Kapabacteria bacterium]|jgi:competence ComEA-like helix-hairpin-helix protein|nr:helix-hairpin-helix domain-containing protein [Candidatus Kapabacteria bacterium]